MLTKTQMLRIGSVLIVCTTPACGDSVVGSDPCLSDDVQCTALSLTPMNQQLKSEAREIPVGRPPQTAPRSIHTMDFALFDNALLHYEHARLTRDQNDNMWVFSVDLAADGVRATRIDETGRSIESVVLAPPEGVYAPSETLIKEGKEYLPQFPEQHAGELSASATIGWRIDCAEEVAPEDGCWSFEQVLLPQGIAAPPLRLPFEPDGAQTSNSQGEVFEIAATPTALSVSKRDRDQRELWTQNDFKLNGKSRIVHGVTLADGGIALSSIELFVAQDSQRIFMPLTYWIDAKGQVTESFRPQSLLTDRSYVLSNGTTPVVVATDMEGDLTVHWLEKSPPKVRGVEFVRQGYWELIARGAALAADGWVYVLTRTGERDALYEAMCRANADGQGSCIELPVLPTPGASLALTEIVALAGGVVFGRIDNQLVRFDFAP